MNIQRTPVFYMANLGAEVSRIISSRERGDTEGARNALMRSFSIIEKVLSFEEMKPRIPEINILKNVLESMAKTNLSSSENENLKSYFDPFASRLIA